MDRREIVNSTNTIFSWIINDCSLDPAGESNESLTLRKQLSRCNRAIANCGSIFGQEKTPSLQEEEGHYMYYYGDISDKCQGLPAADVLPYLEKGSHQWIATALCVLAASVKYKEHMGVQLGTNRKKKGVRTVATEYPELDKYLNLYPLEHQAKKCKEFFEIVASGNNNPEHISWEHWSAYQSVFRGICEAGFETVHQTDQFVSKWNVGQATRQVVQKGYQACLWFLRGYIISVAANDEKNSWTCYQNASKQEPKYYFWGLNKYLVGRKNNLFRSSAESLRVATQAFESSPPGLENRTGVSMMVAGLQHARFKCEMYWTDGKWKLLELILKNLKIQNATDFFGSLHTKWLCIKISELYIRCSRVDESEEETCPEEIGKELLEECHSRFPNCMLTSSALAILHEKGSPSGMFISHELSNSLKKEELSLNAPLLFQFHVIQGDWESNTARMEGAKIRFESRVRRYKEAASDFKLECPAVWILNYIEKLPKYTVQKFGSTMAYLQSRLRLREYLLPTHVQKKEIEIETGGDSTGNADPIAGRDPPQMEILCESEEWICGKLCSAVVTVYLQGCHKSCKNSIEESLLALNEDKLAIPEEHRQAFQYLLEASSLFNDLLSSVACNQVKPEQIKKLNASTNLKMQSKWQLVRNSAVMHYVKGRLTALLGVVHDVSLTQYRKAASLEPEYFLWHQILYEVLKQTRKSGCNRNAPTDEEVVACKKARELRPENVKYAMDLATIKSEDLGAKIRGNLPVGLFNAAADAQDIEQLLCEVINKAKAKENWSRFEMLAKLKMAELFTAHGLPLRTLEAQTIFLECYQKWPKSSMVLHKVGKFYHYTARVYPKALEIYEEAMQASPQNYPCLMDYLKLHGKYLRKFREMVVVIDKCLPRIRESEHILSILIIKGQAYWLLEDKKAACSAWIEAFVKFEWLAFRIEEALASEFSSVFGELTISWAEMCPLFKQSCPANLIPGNKAVGKFIGKLETAERTAYSGRFRGCQTNPSRIDKQASAHSNHGNKSKRR